MDQHESLGAYYVRFQNIDIIKSDGNQHKGKLVMDDISGKGMKLNLIENIFGKFYDCPK